LRAQKYTFFNALVTQIFIFFRK